MVERRVFGPPAATEKKRKFRWQVGIIELLCAKSRGITGEADGYLGGGRTEESVVVQCGISPGW